MTDAIRAMLAQMREALEAYSPPLPPAHAGENDDAYTDRLTGADRKNQRPYAEHRNRQCSIGYHGECTDPEGERCKCPCHRFEALREAALALPVDAALAAARQQAASKAAASEREVERDAVREALAIVQARERALIEAVRAEADALAAMLAAPMDPTVRMDGYLSAVGRLRRVSNEAGRPASAPARPLDKNALADAIDAAVPELWGGIQRLAETAGLPYPDYKRQAVVWRMVNAVLAAVEAAPFVEICKSEVR